MPYKIIKQKCRQSSGVEGEYILTKELTGEKVSCHTSEEMAKKAIRARHMRESYPMYLQQFKNLLENKNNIDINKISKLIGIDWTKYKFTQEDLLKGIKEEMEHGSQDPQTDITNGTNNPVIFAKIALAHLKERPDYYEMLEKAE